MFSVAKQSAMQAHSLTVCRHCVQVHPMLQSVLGYSDRFSSFKSKEATINVRECVQPWPLTPNPCLGCSMPEEPQQIPVFWDAPFGRCSYYLCGFLVEALQVAVLLVIRDLN